MIIKYYQIMNLKMRNEKNKKKILILKMRKCYKCS